MADACIIYSKDAVVRVISNSYSNYRVLSTFDQWLVVVVVVLVVLVVLLLLVVVVVVVVVMMVVVVGVKREF